MIVVTGATSNIGTELLRLLSEGSEPVRALSRRPPEDSSLPGVEWATADLEDRDTLPPVFHEADGLFL